MIYDDLLEWEVKRILRKIDGLKYNKTIKELSDRWGPDGPDLIKEDWVQELVRKECCDNNLLKSIDERWCKLELVQVINGCEKANDKINALKLLWEWQRSEIGDDIDEINVNYTRKLQDVESEDLADDELNTFLDEKDN